MPITNHAPILSLAALAIGMLAGQPAFAEARPVSDADITAEVYALLGKDAALKAEPAGISVETVAHVVYLHGSVDTRLQKDAAETIARTAPDVSKVVNELSVGR